MRDVCRLAIVVRHNRKDHAEVSAGFVLGLGRQDRSEQANQQEAGTKEMSRTVGAREVFSIVLLRFPLFVMVSWNG